MKGNIVLNIVPYNVPYKGLRNHYVDFIKIKARRGRTLPIYPNVFRDWIKANYTPILMEWWEFELRIKMERELPNKLYRIGVKPFIAHTGKQGYIEFEIAMHKETRKYEE